MDLLNWFICWVSDNHDTFSAHEQEELNALIRRIKIELQDSSDSKNDLNRSGVQQSENSETRQSQDGKTSTEDDGMGKNVFSFGVHDIFLSLVKIYLKDVKQINLSNQTSTIESSIFDSEEEIIVDNDSDEEEISVCDDREIDLQSSSNSCSSTGEEKNNDGDSSPETSPVQTNCSNINATSEVRPASSSRTLESSKKLRQIRQNLKKLAVNCLKLDENADADAISHLHEMLISNRFELDAIEGNARLDAARQILIEHSEKLIARLTTLNPPSSSATNGQPPGFGKPNTSSLNRIAQVQELAERVNEDMKVSLLDSRSDKDFLHFDEKLTNYLIQLDCIQCSNDDSLLVARKKVVKYIQRLICCLEVKVFLDIFLMDNINDPLCSLTRDETLLRIQQAESLMENIEYLSATSNEYSDDYFSIETLLRKCLVQLRFIDCQNDEQLLDDRQKVIDFAERLLPPQQNALDTERLTPQQNASDTERLLTPQQNASDAERLLTSQQNVSNFASTNSCYEQVPHCSATSVKGFDSIKKVEQESERLNVHIEFGSFQSRTDRIYIYVEETLTKLLINLDSVNCDGNEALRAARKKAVMYINQLTENLEAKVPVSA